jgi:hypothetical protein
MTPAALVALLILAAPSAVQAPVLRLGAGFAPMRLDRTIRAENGLGTRENFCTGYVQRAPVLEFDLTADSLPSALEVRLESEVDTVLAVVQPGEEFGGGMAGPEYCSDDEGGGINPAVVLRDPRPGRYQVLAGAFAPGVTADVVLTVRERPAR